MIRTLVARCCMVALSLGTSAAVLAQSGSIAYDPAAELTISGTIQHAVSFPAADGSVGVHFDFKTATGIVNVHVAPAMFIGQENFWFFADDRLEIVGVKALIDENSSFIARSITKDGKTLTLRRAGGAPAWSPAIEGADGCGVNHTALPRGTER